MKLKRKVIEGYLYPCCSMECRGVIIYPKKLTLDDFQKIFDHWRGRSNLYEADVDEEVKLMEEALQNDYLDCGLVRPCNESEKYGLGKKAIELVDYLEMFKGKKVRITVEVIE